MRRCWLLVYILLLLAAPAAGQVSGPAFVFVDGTVASPDEVNTNFQDIYDAALNRLGGTMAGAILFSPDNTYDIGASGATRPRDFFLGRNATIGGTLGVTGTATFGTAVVTTLTCTGCVGATQLASTAVTAASYGSATAVPTFTVDADGRLTAAGTTATSALTGIVETAITDGSILARVASNENISGVYTFTNVLRVSGNAGLVAGEGFTLAGGFASPVVGRIFIGDATGYRIHISTRAASTTVDRFTFFDNGDFTATGAVAGTAGTFSGAVSGTTGTFSGAVSAPSYGAVSGTTGTFSGAVSMAGLTATTGTFSGAVSAASMTLSSTFRLPDGTITAPGIAFTNQTGSGFYRPDSTRIVYANSSTDVLSIGAASSGNEMYMPTRAAGAGAVSGGTFYVSRNSSGSGAAGSIGVMRRGTTDVEYIWSDGGTLRVGPARPTESDSVAHSSGTVIGDQTSTLASKDLLAQPDDEILLQRVLKTPVWDFTYKDGRYNGETFTGIVTDESPWFGKDRNRALNEINGIGYLVGAVRALERRLAAVEGGQ